MNSRKPGIDKRRSARHPRRIPCEVWIQGARHGGIVKDVSTSGLFVHTRAKASAGTEVTVVVPADRSRAEVRVSGRVVRSDRLQAHLAMRSAGGIGVEVSDPSALAPLIGVGTGDEPSQAAG